MNFCGWTTYVLLTTIIPSMVNGSKKNITWNLKAPVIGNTKSSVVNTIATNVKDVTLSSPKFKPDDNIQSARNGYQIPEPPTHTPKLMPPTPPSYIIGQIRPAPTLGTITGQDKFSGRLCNQIASLYFGSTPFTRTYPTNIVSGKRNV
ncbi:uncharacterized protein LOC142237533 [Haematobia irritans]|uniref:uncharacterized protein LOC142237533 n=1 Tax=Haematobia irritans TaxID=7368 RepID=UPI003F50ABD8